MKTVALILFGLFVFAQGGVIEKDFQPRIVNGEITKAGERPFQVSLQRPNHFCGGSIINEYWVVTAAHCVISKVGSIINVVVGTVQLTQPHSSHSSSQIIIHKQYSSVTKENDIALVKVSTPFQFSSRVQPVPLPTFHAEVKTNSSAVVSGWGGKVNSWSGTPNDLQKVTIFIADLKYCQKIMLKENKKVHPTNVCANDPSIRRGQCNGDSGGPLTVDGVLIGVVSWSIKDPDCASTTYPGIYTRISEYVDWIHENAK